MEVTEIQMKKAEMLVALDRLQYELDVFNEGYRKLEDIRLSAKSLIAAIEALENCGK